MTERRFRKEPATRVVSVLGTLMLLSTVLAVSSLSEAQVGVKAGDFIRYDFTVSGAPSGFPVPTEFFMEILSVQGTNVTARVTLKLSDGTEQNSTGTVDIVSGQGTIGATPGFIIPAGLTTGASIMIPGFGTFVIQGEATKTYVGAARTVVFTDVAPPTTPSTNLSYYWDKETGILVEVGGTSAGSTIALTPSETNMWGPDPAFSLSFFLQAWVLAVIAGLVVAVIAAIYIMRRRRPPA